MPAFFKCKNCGQDHPSPLYFCDEISFVRDQWGLISLSCPVTQKTSAYGKRDMFWLRDERRPMHQHR